MRSLVLVALLAVAGVSASSKKEDVPPPKILVYNPRFAHSHSNFMGQLADVLADAGHDVTSLIPIIYPPFKDSTYKSKIVHVPGHPETVEMFDRVLNGGDMSKVFLGGSNDPRGMIAQIPLLAESFTGQCNYTINRPGLLESLRAEKFDVVLAENFDFCGIGIAHLIEPKSLVVVSTTNIFDYQAVQVGAPLAASHVPGSFGILMEECTLWQRITNLFMVWANIHVFSSIEASVQGVFKRNYGAEFPDLGEVTGKASLVLTNTDPLLDFARPTLRNVIDVGGLGVRVPGELSKEWVDILARRPHAVVVSFGTVARSFLMPDSFKTALVGAFKRFPNVTFIWKYEREGDTFAESAENVILTPWMPQNELLFDPRVVGIISHGGKGSLSEAAEHGVPAIFVPLFADQPRNAAAGVHLGFGRILDKQQLDNEEAIVTEIRHLLEDKDLHINAQTVRKTLAGRPFSARELVVRNIEFAARHGPQKAFDYNGRHLSFIVYHNLDIAAIVLGLLALVVFLVIKLLSRFIFPSKSSAQARKQKKH